MGRAGEGCPKDGSYTTLLLSRSEVKDRGELDKRFETRSCLEAETEREDTLDVGIAVITAVRQTNVRRDFMVEIALEKILMREKDKGA